MKSSKEKRREYHNRYYSKHSKLLKERGIRWKENNFEKRLISIARCNARHKGLEFNIDVHDIVIPEKCPYLDITLTRIQGQGRIDSNASIDRIDSSKGYIKGNIQIVSALANKMKQNATEEQLITFAKNVLRGKIADRSD